MRCIPALLLLACCGGPEVAADHARAEIEGALSGPSALLYGLCPEAPPAHDSFTGLTAIEIEITERRGARLRASLRGAPLAPDEAGELRRAEARCEGEILAEFSRGSPPTLEQMTLLRGRLPGATFR